MTIFIYKFAPLVIPVARESQNKTKRKLRAIRDSVAEIVARLQRAHKTQAAGT